MPKPVEYRKFVRGFGTWQIVYDPEVKAWQLVHHPHIGIKRPERVGQFHLAESAAIAVAKQRTGFSFWDNFGFGRGMNFDLANWTTEKSEGVQADA